MGGGLDLDSLPDVEFMVCMRESAKLEEIDSEIRCLSSDIRDDSRSCPLIGRGRKGAGTGGRARRALTRAVA